MNLMILAAGEGTRLRPFTLEKPKPRIPFLSVPLAFYSLSLFEELPLQKLVVNTYHLPEQIRELFKLVPPTWREIHFSHEYDKLLGSGGGIHNARQYLLGKDPFFVVNGDEVILPHHYGLLQDMLQFHRWHKGIATLMTTDHPEVGHKFGGAWTKDSSRVVCFSKKNPGEIAPYGHHFVGVLLLDQKVFKYFNDNVIEENILYETLTRAMADGEEVHVFKSQCQWFETGNPEDFLKATEFCLDSFQTQFPTKPYWLEHLMQTIRRYSRNELFVEKQWPRVEELKRAILDIKKGLL